MKRPKDPRFTHRPGQSSKSYCLNADQCLTQTLLLGAVTKVPDGYVELGVDEALRVGVGEQLLRRPDRTLRRWVNLRRERSAAPRMDIYNLFYTALARQLS